MEMTTQTMKDMNGKMKNALTDKIAELEGENRRIDEWLTGGKWTKDHKAFLESWLGADYGLESNGRTDSQMAFDFVGELLEMKLRNEARMFVAKYYLGLDKYPKSIESRWLGWYYYEEIVDRMVDAITNAD